MSATTWFDSFKVNLVQSMLNIVKWWVHIVKGSRLILSSEPFSPPDSCRTFIWIPEIQSNTYLCRNWTSAICSIYNIASGIPSTSTKCNKIFSSRWVKVKLGIVYRWSVQVQGSPISSHEHTLFCSTYECSLAAGDPSKVKQQCWKLEQAVQISFIPV